MKSLEHLKVKLFADGADKKGMLEMNQKSYIRGFTTNPTLMRKAQVADYAAFAQEMLQLIPDKPIAFEVFADELDEMAQQAREITRWGRNVYVKIPITNTQGVSTLPIIKSLSYAGIALNITAVFTEEQAAQVANTIAPGVPTVLSVYAGRIADVGIDPVPIMKRIRALLNATPHIELLWASSREVLNIIQANDTGCDIITATHDILNKLHLIGKNLNDYSLETVKMFYQDAQASAFSIESVFS